MNNITEHRNFVIKQIQKSFENDIEKAKHNVGDIHPNGKRVWTQLSNGKFDWRTRKKTDTAKDSVGAETKSNSTTAKPQSAGSTSKNVASGGNDAWWRRINSMTTSQKISEVSTYYDDTTLGNEEFDAIVDDICGKGTAEKLNDKLKNVRNYDERKKSFLAECQKVLSQNAQKKFISNFKDASDDVLRGIVSGKIQATIDEKKWAKTIFDERKKGQMNSNKQQGGNTSSSGNAAWRAKIDETTIDQAEYNSQLKMAKQVGDDARSAAKTFIQSNIDKTKGDLQDAIANKPGAKATINTLQKKLTKYVSQKKAVEDAEKEIKNNSKGDTKQDKIAQDAGFKNYEEMSGWQSYVTAKNLLKKPSMKLKSKEADRKALEKQVADYEKDHANVIAAHSGGKKAVDSYASMDIKDAKKALVGKVVTLADYWPDGRGGSQDAIGEIKNVRLYGKNKTPIAEVVYPNGDEQIIRLDEIDDGKMKDSYSTAITIGDDKTKLDAVKNKISKLLGK